MSKRTLSEKELLFLGKIKFEEQNFREAVFYFTKAIKINSGNSELYIMRGDTYLGEYTQRADKRAIKDYTRAIELTPDNSDAYVKRAVARTFYGDYKKVLRDLQSAQKIPCENMIIKDINHIFYESSPYWDYENNLQGLEEIMDKFIEIYPNDFREYKARVFTCGWFKGNWYAVLEDCRSALALYPYIYEYSDYMPDFDYDLFNKLGKVEYKRKNYDLASIYFKRVLNNANICHEALRIEAHDGLSRIAIKRNSKQMDT